MSPSPVTATAVFRRGCVGAEGTLPALSALSRARSRTPLTSAPSGYRRGATGALVVLPPPWLPPGVGFVLQRLSDRTPKICDPLVAFVSASSFCVRGIACAAAGAAAGVVLFLAPSPLRHRALDPILITRPPSLVLMLLVLCCCIAVVLLYDCCMAVQVRGASAGLLRGRLLHR